MASVTPPSMVRKMVVYYSTWSGKRNKSRSERCQAIFSLFNSNNNPLYTISKQLVQYEIVSPSSRKGSSLHSVSTTLQNG